MFTVDVKQQNNKSPRLMSGANFPPIVAWNLPATSGFLKLSRSNLSLNWVGFLVFFRRTRKVNITRPRGYWMVQCLLKFCTFRAQFHAQHWAWKRSQKFYNLGFMLRLRNCALLSLRMFSKSFITSEPGHGHFLCLLQGSFLSYWH